MRRNRFTLLGEKKGVAREPSSAAASAGAAATTASAPRRGEAMHEKVADRDAGTRAWTRGARRAARDASARIPTRAATMGEWTAVVMVRSVRPCRGEWRARERRSATFSVIHLASSAACGSTGRRICASAAAVSRRSRKNNDSPVAREPSSVHRERGGDGRTCRRGHLRGTSSRSPRGLTRGPPPRAAQHADPRLAITSRVAPPFVVPSGFA